MKVIFLNGSFDLRLKKTCAAIGIFDGVHRGHQYLIKEMIKTARRLKARPVVITFSPHPAHVLKPELKLGYITSLEDRFRLLSALGAAVCVVVRFNRSFARILPQKFIKEILVQKLGVKAVFVGENFRFGKDRSGDIDLFRKCALAYGYEMHAVPSLKQGPAVISSTLIRKTAGEGQLNKARRLLGRPLFAAGAVVTGDGRGRSLGYATANVDYHSDILPPQGVYAVRAVLGAQSFPAVANFGMRPTFAAKNPKPLLEVHILDFSKNIYGRRIKIEFLKKLRGEKKFSSAQQLIRQIQKDISTARTYFASKS